MATRKYDDARIVQVGEMPVCDPSMIPASTARVIGKTIYDAVVLAFQQPGVQEEYARWKARRAQEAANA